eukprot:TRINITY_DN5534_c0_g1_i6.p1 TRINITY_DN5534_c0_g1~~TRINITY_DN5534_c0_g1_i6.p1  ORF type:complete len:163 (-),score=46.52 TRINITY_DN5534_c0_g1_i6:14-502(-)
MEKKVARNILLTGNPGVGKTTAIKKVVEHLKGRAAVGGFYTEEERSEAGVRTGFVVKTLAGSEGLMASVKPGKGPKVGKYIVDIKSIDDVAVMSIREAIKKKEVIILDEIGKMELCSVKFKEVLAEALNTGKVIGTPMYLSLIHICRCRRLLTCRSRWSPYH